MDTPVSMTPGPNMQKNNTLARPQRQSNPINSLPSLPSSDPGRPRPHLLEMPPRAITGPASAILPVASDPSSAWRRAMAQLPLRALALVSPERAAHVALDMFCTPAATKGLSSDDRRADGGASWSTLQVDGNELAICTWGDLATQPYVLLAHDWSGHALEQRALVRVLCAAGYAVVAFDQQGHGRSSGHMAPLPDFICNLLAVGWRHGRAAAVIGHSLGAAAAALALKHGLEADRAILIAAPADPEEALGRFAKALGVAATVRRRMTALLEANTGVPMDDLQAHRIVPWIGRPALVVHDMEDAEVPWSEGERYARCWSDARLLTTSGLGHQRIIRDPQVLVTCLRFLKGEAVGERVVSSPNLPYGFA